MMSTTFRSASDFFAGHVLTATTLVFILVGLIIRIFQPRRAPKGARLLPGPWGKWYTYFAFFY